jgi:ABC-type lipoprotein release transport system permease subunit
MEIEFQWEPALLALAVVLATGTAVAAGLAASAQALARRPVAVLRG